MDYSQLDQKFAAAFRYARLQSGLSQADVAEKLRSMGFDVSQPVVGKIERGVRKVTVGESQAIARIVGKGVDRLLRGEVELKIEAGVEHLQKVMSEAKGSLGRVQGAQLALAMAIDSAPEGSLSEYTLETAEYLLSRTPSDLAAEFEKDTIAETTARNRRDELDAIDEGVPYPAEVPAGADVMKHATELITRRGEAINDTMAAPGFDEATQAMYMEVTSAPPADSAE
ncbi:helix-turn-helix transcriptional regulator [Microbacterium aurum]|uniref:helix-turn-helix domain-containing protein n=1 Tax=Microbacterium aurum TaxID=36805 RepID=UPI0028E678DD|nr:helix-turn-helix transcriptional regulator [Microbacterium aurum]